MTNSNTGDIKDSVEQCIRIIKVGADYVRFTVPSLNDVENIAAIKQELLKRGYNTPIIADVHFNDEVALRVANHVEKVRINPGNFADTKKFESRVFSDEDYRMETKRIKAKLLPLLEKCRSIGVALRIGVNHGSLSDRIMSQYGDTPAGMAESAMEFLRICREGDFDQVVVSMKASNVRVMIQATRLVVKMMMDEGMNFPLHLGVTEAGDGENGRIKSAAGIGALLADGLGDTVRVSLTEDPEAELPVARKIVDHIAQISQHISLPEIAGSPANPYAYSQRVSRVTGNIGGNHVPVVVGELMNKQSDNQEFNTEQAVDYIFVNSLSETDQLPGHTGIIIPYAKWLIKKPGNIYPLLTPRQYAKNGTRSFLMNLVSATIIELDDALIQAIKHDNTSILVYQCTNSNVQAELRGLYYKLKEKHCTIPVIIRLNLNEDNLESFQLKSAADLGGTFIDGFGNGLWLSNPLPILYKDIISTSFSLLQACRARITQTEYISCPSCGRTHFNLIMTLARIKSATSHLKGLKIGVMGCIVNGPGEMADADYGYVGAGKGKITLYKSKEVIKRGIPEEDAVNELINLIKENGDWIQP
jgi:(E)-4-hydroxy-3-methylbut-2-enyl-diphosphate synthase